MTTSGMSHALFQVEMNVLCESSHDERENMNFTPKSTCPCPPSIQLRLASATSSDAGKAV